MWAIFLLATISVAICALLVIYVANKVFIKMKKDRIKFEKEIKTEEKTNE